MKAVGKAVVVGFLMLFALSPGAFRANASGLGCDHFDYCEMTVSSPDGKRVYFVSGDALVRGDWNQGPDIYERAGSKVRLVTHTPEGAGGQSPIVFGYASQNLAKPHLVFATANSYAPGDQDGLNDIYETRNGRVRLLTGDLVFHNLCRSVNCQIEFAGYDPGNSTLFVRADGRLTEDDTDSSSDLYSIRGKQVELLSGGPRDGGSDSSDAWTYRASAGFQSDGRFYFQTREPLVDEDNDQLVDLYARSNSGTELVSDWAGGGSQNYARIDVVFSKAVPGRLYLTARDTWFGSQPPVPENSTTLYLVDPGQQPQPIVSGYVEDDFAGESPDGSTVYFTARESLDPADTDEAVDIYAFSGGVSSLISVGPRNVPVDPGDDEFSSWKVVHVTSGGAVFFLSGEQLVAADTDETTDLYRRDGGSVELVSSDEKGRGGDGAVEGAMFLNDGKRILLTTEEPMVPADGDESRDLYLKTEGKLVLLSGLASGEDSNYGPLEGPVPVQALAGGRYLFVSNGRLNNEDGDNDWDAYMFNPGRPDKPGLVSKGDLSIYRGPAGTVAQGPARFWFRQTGPRTRFVCRMDEKKWRACRSPVTFRKLNDWGHTFEVASVGPRGHGKDAAVSRRFGLDPGDVFTYRWLGNLKVNSNSDRVLLTTTTRKAEKRTGRILMLDQGRVGTIYTGPGDPEVLEADEHLSNVAFRTRERLTQADDDSQPDIYLGHPSGGVRLFPLGRNLIDEPILNNLFDNGYIGASFFTRDQLDPRDQDQALDAYLTGPANSDDFVLASGGSDSSLDAGPFTVPQLDKAVTFYTREQLDPEDTDNGLSIYWGDGETIRYVTSAKLDSKVRRYVADPDPISGSSSGRKFYFSSTRQLLPADTDEHADIYRWSTGDGLSLESWVAVDSKARIPRTGAMGKRAVSRNGDEFLMLTNDTRLPYDSGNTSRLFRVVDGITHSIEPSMGELSYRGSSANLKSVIVSSWDPVVPDDGNSRPDLFLIRNGSVTRMTDTRLDGQTTEPADFKVVWASDEGDRVAFRSRHQLVDSDIDNGSDLYLWKDGQLVLLSKTRRMKSDFTMGAVVTGATGGRYFFQTGMALLESDRNGEPDLYQLSKSGFKRFDLWPNL